MDRRSCIEDRPGAYWGMMKSWTLMLAMLVTHGVAQEVVRPPALVPVPRNELEWWVERHEEKLKEVAKGGYELVFIGDSITQGWEGAGRAVWKEFYGKRKALNLGYSGDRTEHVLWRLQNGELGEPGKLDPKLFVLMIGTNNTGHRRDPPKETAAGIKMIIDLLKRERPGARVLLLSVFPRDGRPDGQLRQINQRINALIKPIADGKRVFWLDMDGVFLNEEGILTVRVMPDGLHPKKYGYQLWARAMEPSIELLME
ncbi:MAG: GDSL-type esterase/lipase family protein [Verrucomicrobiota bacterium]